MPSERYRVVFTPVGWQVIDTRESRDPVAEFGTGQVEYERARLRALNLNEARHGRCLVCGDEWVERGAPVICPECHSTNVIEAGA